MIVGVVTFPGSNCDRDTLRAVDETPGLVGLPVWHAADSVDSLDAIVLPGGFSWGDYLRPGAISARAEIMDSVRTMAEQGKPVIGICNGFQILCEAGLLPGSLQRNIRRRFICASVELTVVQHATPLTHRFHRGQTIALPIAHADGRYVAAADELASLEANGQVVPRYRDAQNGSAHAIAAISNRRGNVIGMMPHPERALSPLLGSSDGATMFTALADTLAMGHPHLTHLAIGAPRTKPPATPFTTTDTRPTEPAAAPQPTTQGATTGVS